MDLQTDSLWPATSLVNWQQSPVKAFDDWIAGLSVIQVRQLRESSIATYRFYFTAWLRFLETRYTSVLEATPQDAEVFFIEQALEPVSRRRYLQLLDRVYRYLKTISWDGRNPMALELMKERALDPSAPPSLEDDEAASVWEAVTRLDGWKGIRDRAMCALILGAGLRSNEVIALAWPDVRRDYQVRVKPSGVHREHKTLILPGVGREYWDTWETERLLQGVISDRAFPATRSGRPYSETGLFRRTDTWLRMANIKRAADRGVNLLRNTFARQALTRYSPEEVQEFMGHAELRATARHGPGEA